MDFLDYKEKNKEYIKQSQKFLDLVDNIQDEKLRKNIKKYRGHMPPVP